MSKIKGRERICKSYSDDFFSVKFISLYPVYSLNISPCPLQSAVDRDLRESKYSKPICLFGAKQVLYMSISIICKYYEGWQFKSVFHIYNIQTNLKVNVRSFKQTYPHQRNGLWIPSHMHPLMTQPNLNSSFFQSLIQGPESFSTIPAEWLFTSVGTIPVMRTHQLLKLPSFLSIITEMVVMLTSLMLQDKITTCALLQWIALTDNSLIGLSVL